MWKMLKLSVDLGVQTHMQVAVWTPAGEWGSKEGGSEKPAEENQKPNISMLKASAS